MTNRDFIYGAGGGFQLPSIARSPVTNALPTIKIPGIGGGGGSAPVATPAAAPVAPVATPVPAAPFQPDQNPNELANSAVTGGPGIDTPPPPDQVGGLNFPAPQTPYSNPFLTDLMARPHFSVSAPDNNVIDRFWIDATHAFNADSTTGMAEQAGYGVSGSFGPMTPYDIAARKEAIQFNQLQYDAMRPASTPLEMFGAMAGHMAGWGTDAVYAAFPGSWVYDGTKLVWIAARAVGAGVAVNTAQNSILQAERVKAGLQPGYEPEQTANAAISGLLPAGIILGQAGIKAGVSAITPWARAVASMNAPTGEGLRLLRESGLTDDVIRTMNIPQRQDAIATYLSGTPGPNPFLRPGETVAGSGAAPGAAEAAKGTQGQPPEPPAPAKVGLTPDEETALHAEAHADAQVSPLFPKADTAAEQALFDQYRAEAILRKAGMADVDIIRLGPDARTAAAARAEAGEALLPPQATPAPSPSPAGGTAGQSPPAAPPPISTVAPEVRGAAEGAVKTTAPSQPRLTAEVNGRTVTFPDDDHARLYALGTLIQNGQKADMTEVQALTQEFSGFIPLDPKSPLVSRDIVGVALAYAKKVQADTGPVASDILSSTESRTAWNLHQAAKLAPHDATAKAVTDAQQGAGAALQPFDRSTIPTAGTGLIAGQNGIAAVPQQIIMQAREAGSTFRVAQPEAEMLKAAGITPEADGSFDTAPFRKEADRRAAAGTWDNGMSVYDNSHLPQAGAAPAIPATPGARAGTFLFDPKDLKTAPENFQFRDGTNEKGVTGALKDVPWDPDKAGQIIVYQADDGALYVADGHQRVDLANSRINSGAETKILIPGALYRASDGFTADDVALIAAMKNLRDGSGSVLDIAAVLRLRPNELDRLAEIGGANVQDAAAIARLSKEVWQLTVDGKLQPRDAAAIGKVISEADPDLQATAARIVAKAKPETALETDILVNRIQKADVMFAERGGPKDLMEHFTGKDSTIPHEVSIVGRAIKTLSKDQAVLRRATASSSKAVGRGAMPSAEASLKLTDIIESVATHPGPARDALLRVAKEVKDGHRSLNEATEAFVSALRGAEKPGATGGSRIGAGGTSNEADLAGLFGSDRISARPAGAAPTPGTDAVRARKQWVDQLNALYADRSGGFEAAIKALGEDASLTAGDIKDIARQLTSEPSSRLRSKAEAIRRIGLRHRDLVVSLKKRDATAGRTAALVPGQTPMASAEFRRWFSGSKVVDAEGQPKVVYHATVASFDQFQVTDADVGIHFGTMAQAEGRLAVQQQANPEGAARVIPAYLSLKNPLRVPSEPRLGDYRRFLEGAEDPAGSKIKTYADARATLEKLGYDGVVYKSQGEIPQGLLTDTVGMAEASRSRPAEDAYIAFRPDQVRSAIGEDLAKAGDELTSGGTETGHAAQPGAKALPGSEVPNAQAGGLQDAAGVRGGPLAAKAAVAAVPQVPALRAESGTINDLVSGRAEALNGRGDRGGSPPPVRADGKVALTHFSAKQLETIDPAAQGTNPTIRGDERQRPSRIPRSYYGIDVGEAGGYTAEAGLGPFRHDTSISPGDLYNHDTDPLKLWAKAAEQTAGKGDLAGKNRFEQLIREAGFAGYWSNNATMGKVAVVFDKLVPEKIVNRETGEVVATNPGPVAPIPKAAPVFAPNPLKGMPGPVEVPGRGKIAFGPFQTARDAAHAYMDRTGQSYDPPTEYVKVSAPRATKIADAYSEMYHDPNDPEVKAAYAAMIKETLDQFQEIKKTGLKIEFIKEGQPDPYGLSPRYSQLDIIENSHLWVYPTDLGFGTITEITKHPLLAETSEVIDGRTLLANDVFRIVHDYFGHLKEGNGFRADGEENAWISHSAMYSPLARKAMTSETRGQNSWVNYGPYGERNRKATAKDTVFADQKAGILPDWVMTEGYPGTRPPDFQADLLGTVDASTPAVEAPDGSFYRLRPVTPETLRPTVQEKPLPKGVSLVVDKANREVRAVKGGKTVAYLSLEKYGEEAKRNEVFNMATVPEYQRQGLQTSMRVAAEKEFGQTNPSPALSDEGFAFWSRFRPSAIADDLRLNRAYLVGQEVMTNFGPGKIVRVASKQAIADLTEKKGQQAPVQKTEIARLLAEKKAKETSYIGMRLPAAEGETPTYVVPPAGQKWTAEQARDAVVAQSAIPASDSSLADISPAVKNSDRLGPPGTQALPSQVSTRPVPSGSETARATEPSSSREGGIRTFNDFKLGSLIGGNRYVWQATVDYKALMAGAKELVPTLKADLANVIKDVPGTVVLGVRPKAEEGILGKLASGRPAQSISDYLGGRIAVDSADAIKGTLTKLGQTFRILQIDDFLSQAHDGYRAIHVQADMGNGMSAEIQIVPRPIAAVQEIAHKLYDTVKRLDPQHLTDNDFALYAETKAQVRKIFDDSWKAAGGDEAFDAGLSQTVKPAPKQPVRQESARPAKEPDVTSAVEQAFVNHVKNAPLRGEPKRPAAGIPEQPGLPPATRLADLTTRLKEALAITLRDGRLPTKVKGAPAGKIMGVFNKDSGVVRLRERDNYDVFSHEAGHHFYLRNGKEVDRLVTAHVGEVTALAPRGYALGLSKDEGFAEFFRLYMTNRNYLKSTAPGFLKAFDEWLAKSNGPLHGELADAFKTYDDLIHSSSRSIVTADIVTSGNPTTWQTIKDVAGGAGKDIIKGRLPGSDRLPTGQSLFSFFDRIYTWGVDRLHPINRAVRAAVYMYQLETGKTLDLAASENAYKLARMATNAYQSGHISLADGVVPYRGGPTGNQIDPSGPSFAKAVELAVKKNWYDSWQPADILDFGGYLASRRMVQEWKRYDAGDPGVPNPPGKLSSKEYQQAIKDYEKANPQYVQAADMIYEWNRNLLQKKFDAGLVSREYYDRGMAKSDYVPLQRDFSEEYEEALRSAGTQGVNKQSIMKSFRGSTRSVLNPLESMMTDAYNTEAIIARNDVIRALYYLAKKAGPDGGGIAELIPATQMKAVKFDIMDALRAAGRDKGLNPDDVDDLILQASDKLDAETFMTTIFRPAEIQEKGEPIVYFWEGGERKAVRLPDGDFGKEVFQAITGIGQEQSTWWMNMLAIPSRALRMGITTNLSFFAANYIRDQVSAAVLNTKFIPFVSGAKGMFEEVMQKRNARLYSQFGGIMGGTNVASLHEARVDHDVTALRGRGYTIRRLKDPREWLALTEISETGTRLGLFGEYFRTAQKQGLSQYDAAFEAAFESRDFMDFGRNGSKMLAARRLVTFLNAAVQGSDKVVRTLFTDLGPLAKVFKGMPLTREEARDLSRSGQAWAKIGTITALSATYAALYKDDPEFQDASEYLRATNWFFKMPGGDWAMIPKPYEMATVFNLGERMVDAMMQNDPTWADKWIRSWQYTLQPPSEAPGLMVPIEMMFNHDSFRGRPIVSDVMQGLEPQQQFDRYTSEFSKAVSNATGGHLGVGPLSVPLSPLMVDHLLLGWGGSWARDLLALGDKTNPQRQTDKLYDWPVSGRFVKNLSRGSDATDKFYGLISATNGRLQEKLNTYNSFVKAGRDDAAAAYYAKLADDEKTWIASQTQDSAGEKRTHPLRRAHDVMAVYSGLEKDIADRNIVPVLGLSTDRISINPTISMAIYDQLGRAAAAEARNAMILVGEPGWKGREFFDPQPYLDAIRKLDPRVAAELNNRLYKQGVVKFEGVKTVWPAYQQRILEKGPGVFTGDLRAGALLKGMMTPEMMGSGSSSGHYSAFGG